MSLHLLKQEPTKGAASVYSGDKYLDSGSNTSDKSSEMEVDRPYDQLTGMDHTGHLKFSSQIPWYPKPLALAYVNFHNHYTKYILSDGERMLAGNILITALLAHYFPKPKYKLLRWTDRRTSLIHTVPAQGTLYWAVTKNENCLTATDIATSEIEKPHAPATGINREDLAVPPEYNSLVLLAAVVTATEFINRPERRNPSKLNFRNDFLENNGTIVVNGKEYRNGNVLILGGKPKLNENGKSMATPTFEFYNFDTGSIGGISLVPWFGQLEDEPRGLHTNTLSLALADVEKVDRMFQALRRISRFNRALSPSAFQVSPQNPIKRKASGSLPWVAMPSHTPNNMSHEFLMTLKNEDDKLQMKDGKLFLGILEKEAIRQMKERGIQISDSLSSTQAPPIRSSKMTDEFLMTLKKNKVGKIQGRLGRYLPKAQAEEAIREIKARGLRIPGF